MKDAIKAVASDGQHLSDSVIRTHDPGLYGACVRLFGSYTAARAAAGIKWGKCRRASYLENEKSVHNQKRTGASAQG